MDLCNFYNLNGNRGKYLPGQIKEENNTSTQTAFTTLGSTFLAISILYMAFRSLAKLRGKQWTFCLMPSMKLLVKTSNFWQMNSRCCFSFCAYSEEFSFPNFFSRSCIGNLTNILAGSTSRKTSSSDNNLRIGSCSAEVRNNLAENNSPL